MPAPSQTYLDTLLRYYEEEIEGEAYFSAIAARMETDADQHKMQLLAEVETYAARAVRPLLEKYALSPASTEALHAVGRKQAADSPGGFDDFIRQWRLKFPEFIDEFEALEAMAPPEDLPVLKILTDHEHAAIAFIEREATGQTDSTAPLHHYLRTGTA